MGRERRKRQLGLRASLPALVAAFVALGACSGESGTSNGNGFSSGGASAAAGTGATSAGGNGGSAASSTGGGGGVLAIDSGAGGSSANGGSSASGGSAGGGNEDSCNGIDDDHNGIVDDVDKGKDGICDCLRIATLGARGRVGNGSVFNAWLTARSDFGATDLGSQTLTKTLLDSFQVIVAQDLSVIGRSYSAAEVAALDAWVRAGGGLMTLIGYADPSEIANANLLLAGFGQSYGSQPILAKVGGSTVPITNWVPHPITNGVTKVGVDNGYAAQGGTPLAGAQGFTLLTVTEPDSGHVAVWGDEWITFNSEWSGHPDYQVELFWVNVIKWLTPSLVCQVPVPPNIH